MSQKRLLVPMLAVALVVAAAVSALAAASAPPQRRAFPKTKTVQQRPKRVNPAVVRRLRKTVWRWQAVMGVRRTFSAAPLHTPRALRTGAGRRVASRGWPVTRRTGTAGSASTASRGAGKTAPTRTGAACRWTAALCAPTRLASFCAGGGQTTGPRSSRCGSPSGRTAAGAGTRPGRTRPGTAVCSNLSAGALDRELPGTGQT